MKNFFWNMMGSAVYAFATIILVMIAKRMFGETSGAMFYMAFTTGQMLLTVGYFEIRPFQVTDITREYKPSEYFGFRIITSLAMMICAVLVGGFYLASGRANIAGVFLIVAVSAFKMCDGFSDVFEGEFQRLDRIDVSGKSMTFRTLFSLIVFTVFAYFTHNVYVTSLAAAVAAAVGCVAVVYVWHDKFEKIAVSFNKDKMKTLFKSTVFLFLGSAMCNWIWNGTKYMVEWNLTYHDTIVYGIVFMPNMVINLGSGFLFKPMLTTLAKHYENKDRNAFMKLMYGLFAWVLVVTAITLAAGITIGIPILSWMYDMDLVPYKSVMMVLILGGGFNALSIVLYYAMTTMRKQRQIFAGYILAFAASVGLPGIMIKQGGIMGAAMSYLLVMTILTVVYLIMLFINVGRFGVGKSNI